MICGYSGKLCEQSAVEYLEYLESARCLTEMDDRHPEPIPLATEGQVRLDHRARKAPRTRKWEAELTLMNSPRHESGRRGRVPLRYDTGDGSRGQGQNRRGRPASPGGWGKAPPRGQYRLQHNPKRTLDGRRFGGEQPELKPGLCHGQSPGPGAGVPKAGLSSPGPPLFSRAPPTSEKIGSLPTTLERLERFSTTIGRDPGGPGAPCACRSRVMRRRSVNVGDKPRPLSPHPWNRECEWGGGTWVIGEEGNTIQDTETTLCSQLIFGIQAVVAVSRSASLFPAYGALERKNGKRTANSQARPRLSSTLSPQWTAPPVGLSGAYTALAAQPTETRDLQGVQGPPVQKKKA
ncbi:hypothetical protein D4764_04G0003840 [Takifugu flavidus]|uniref:Uncharacterized protein n=1 Tax=Takifugu flavidus TaxID=433684 RepID=A0A5C6N7P9_9TELE|nr:hypothetical protein D4764_04G0003840 [Takifugu flavidus]